MVSLLFQFTLFIAGMILLLKGSDLFVEASIKIAKYFKVSEFIIGLTIVSIGTTLPELASSIIAAFSQNGSFIFGTVFGGNLANIGLILGLCALIGTITVKKEFVKIEQTFFHKDAIILFVTSLLVLILTADGIIDLKDSLILLTAFFANVLFIISEKFPKINILSDLNIIEFLEARKRSVKNVDELKKKEGHKFLFKQLSYFTAGLIIIIFSANLVVQTTSNIATILLIPTSLIAITLVAFGTSLPEFFVAITSVRKKKSELMMGNIIGSCTSRLLLVLGSTAAVSPIIFSVDLLALPIIANLVMVTAMLFFIRKKWGITKLEGFILFTLYIFFLINIFIQGTF